MKFIPEIPYYLKNRIVHQVINVFMLLILFINLFPIGWMIYNSFKDNQDILSGKISFSRAKNRVLALQEQNDKLFVCSQDGGINDFNLKTKKIDQYTSVKTIATNFTLDDKYVWVSSGDQGVIRVTKDNLSEKKNFSIPVGALEVSKVGSTAIVRDGDRVWYTLRYRNFQKVYSFSSSNKTVLSAYDMSCELSPLQLISLCRDGDYLWVGADKGLIKFDVKAEKIAKVFNLQYEMPTGINQVERVGNRLLLISNGGAYFFDPKSGRVLGLVKLPADQCYSQIERATVSYPAIYFGMNGGMVVYDAEKNQVVASTTATSNTPTITTTGTQAVAAVNQCDVIQEAAVSSIAVGKTAVFLGEPDGRVALYSRDKNFMHQFVQGKAGQIVVVWRNYIDMWQNINFGLFLKNSFIICGFTMLIAMALATMAAYAISRFNFPGNREFSTAILATQMIPSILYLIPLFISFTKFSEWTHLPLIGTYWGMIFIYSAFFVPFSIWILRGFFAAIPIELEEAARIDGCNPLQVFWHVVLPLAIPGIIATGIYVFLTAWDELMFAWVLTNETTQTIPVGIRLFVGNYQNRFDLMMAAAVVATLPVLILFFLLQKQIVKGLTAGAVKG